MKQFCLMKVVPVGGFLAFLFVAQAVSGQGKLMPGYAVMSTNDTIRGNIRHEGWTQSPAKIGFRAARDETDQLLLLRDQVVLYY